MRQDRLRIYTVPAVTDSESLQRLAAQECGGFTVTHTRGGWVDDGGAVVIEDSAVFEVIGAMGGLMAVLRSAREVAEAAGESAILTTLERVDATLINLAGVLVDV